MKDKVFKILINDEALPLLFLSLLFSAMLLNFDIFIIGKSSALQPGDPGPTFLPFILLLTGFFLSAGLLVTSIAKKTILMKKESLGIDELADKSLGTGIEEEKMEESFLLLFAIIIITFLYVFSLTKIGFVVGSILFLTLIQLVLRQKNIIKSYVIFPIGVLLVTYLFFVKALSVAFPRGIGIFEQISRFFY